MNKNPITLLKNTRPDPFTKEEQERVWQHVVREVDFERFPAATTTKQNFPLWFQPAFAFAMGLMLILTGNYTVMEANAASPGDLLYPLDLALERVQIAVTPKQKRETLYYQHALERIDEFETYVQTATEDTEATAVVQKREQYVAEYLEHAEEQLSPADRERVRRRFAAMTAPQESVRTESQTETQTAAEPVVEEKTIEPQQRTQEQTQINTYQFAPTQPEAPSGTTIPSPLRQQTTGTETKAPHTRENSTSTEDQTESGSTRTQTKTNTETNEPDPNTSDDSADPGSSSGGSSGSGSGSTGSGSSGSGGGSGGSSSSGSSGGSGGGSGGGTGGKR